MRLLKAQDVQSRGSCEETEHRILEFRSATGRSEYEIFREYFRGGRYHTELKLRRDQLGVQEGVRRAANGFNIDLISADPRRRIFAALTLNHPLVQAYRTQGFAW